MEDQTPTIPSSEPIQPQQNNYKWIKTLAIGFSIVSFCVAIGVILYVLGTRKNQTLQQRVNEQNLVVFPSSSVQVSPTIDPTTNWKTYTLKSLGLIYELPPSVVSLGDLQEFIIPGQQGTQIFVSTENSKVISDKKFLMGTTSIDYVAGRGGMFIDLQGFTKQNGKYYARFVHNQTIELPIDAVTEVASPTGLQIIKIKGENYTSGEGRGLPITGTPGEGKIGALINVNKTPYQGFTVQMDLTSTLTEQLFDQILSTFKFTK